MASFSRIRGAVGLGDRDPFDGEDDAADYEEPFAGDVVTFLTWSGANDTVHANTVELGIGRATSAQHKVVASHVGTHAAEAPTPPKK